MKEFENIQFNKRIFGKKPRSLSNDIGNLLFCFVICVFYIFMLFSDTYTGTLVKGPSMMPTFNKDYYTNKTQYDLAYYVPVKDNKYKRGDIVIADAGGEDPIIKRVIGLPGEKVEIKQYSDEMYYVYINGERLEENYIYSRSEMVVEYDKFILLFGTELIVPEGEVFILGDNRANSNDSTMYGCFKFEKILGRVDYIVFANDIPAVSLFLQIFLPYWF